MSTLDFDGARLLEHYQDLEGSAALQPVPDSTGTDPSGDLALVVDAARRVRRAHVVDGHRLRTPAALRGALTAAYAEADAARGAASLEESGYAEQWMREADDLLQGRRRLFGGTPPSTRRADALLRRTGSAPAPAPVTGRSDHGYLTITRDQRGDVVDVDVDQEWLQAVRDDRLAAAIEQAFDATQEPR